MIGITFYGRLGNQMFQYAAARLAAERLGCEHVIISRYRSRAQLARYAASKLIAPRQRNWSIFAEISQCFPTATQGAVGVALQLAGERGRDLVFGKSFVPRKMSIAGTEVEAFDNDYFNVSAGTMLHGYYQSEKYFAGHEDKVRRWYAPSPADRSAAQAIIERQWRRPCDQVVAIHVRRTDYISPVHPFGHPELGEALPDRYYWDALSHLPEGLMLAVFSDDPDYAAEMFGPYGAWIARGNSASCDLHLMSLCRYMVIANSSMSWWAAWLNSRADKIVIAPKYHLGWWKRHWFPDEIAVAGWNYIDVAV